MRTDRPAGNGANTPSRFVYLLLTHRDVDHVEELAARIVELSPDAQVVVHHDVTGGAAPWRGTPRAPFHLVERSRVQWGDWSMVEATLRLMRFATEELQGDWLVLLSGEHRPVTDLRAWESSVARSGVDALLPAERLPDRLRFGRRNLEPNQYLARSRHRWVVVSRPRSELMQRSIGGITKIGSRVHPLFALEYVHRRQAWALGTRRRQGPMRDAVFYRGTQWIALNRRSAVRALRADPAVMKWFKRSWIPDEAYVHTLLRRTSDLVVSNEPTTFVLKTPRRPTSGWMRLSLDDLPAVWASGAPFARKVDPVHRPEVLRAIDDAVDRRVSTI